ncbi:ATP-binding cassette domain-containing protein [Treponema parvum]|uniref:ATP-binding cassette domain-containing protein n=1 Tax=Treponema parvum TaxID=138851 RepID=A0A975ICZ6_9SPIR|nr:ATP-binding cassette domain-containing protein [Treponema parvum]QTQ12223.1 ATP-binding cassette domain-containing protein [Treponema parvum]
MTVSLKNITVSFPRKTALDNICLSFTPGKIHALLGENGAGKSTLASILSGDIRATSGQIVIDGAEVVFKDPRQAADNGIQIVRQRPLLARDITALENILLGSEQCNISNRFIKSRIETYKKSWAPSLKTNLPVRDMGGDERFFTALLCALCREPKILILDEPSVFLNTEQRSRLYKNLRESAQKGVTIIVITHSMSEAQNNTDTVTVLEKGKIIARYENSSDFKRGSAGYSDFEVRAEETSCRIKNFPFSKNFISLSGVTLRPVNRPALFDVSLTAKNGEITLVQGLSESGLGTLEDLMLGMEDTRGKGKFTLSCSTGLGKSRLTSRRRTAAEAKPSFIVNLAKKNLTSAMLRGKKYATCAMIPSDRVFRASNPELTVEQILTVYYKGNNPVQYADSLIKKANVFISPTEKAVNLSGGMLQRLILAREMEQNPEFLILCEPLQGLDSHSASAMCDKLFKYAEDGKCVIVLSTQDFPENLCGRIYVLSDGRIKQKIPSPLREISSGASNRAQNATQNTIDTNNSGSEK